jgi:ribosome-binding factor A
MSDNDTARRKTFSAIEHAARHIQTQLGQKMTSKYCPHLRFHEDIKFKNTLDTLRIIEEASKEFREKDSEQDSENDLD